MGIDCLKGSKDKFKKKKMEWPRKDKTSWEGGTKMKKAPRMVVKREEI